MTEECRNARYSCLVGLSGAAWSHQGLSLEPARCTAQTSILETPPAVQTCRLVSMVDRIGACYFKGHFSPQTLQPWPSILKLWSVSFAYSWIIYIFNELLQDRSTVVSCVQYGATRVKNSDTHRDQNGFKYRGPRGQWPEYVVVKLTAQAGRAAHHSLGCSVQWNESDVCLNIRGSFSGISEKWAAESDFRTRCGQQQLRLH